MWMIPKAIIGMYLICMACIQVIKYPRMRILGYFRLPNVRCSIGGIWRRDGLSVGRLIYGHVF